MFRLECRPLSILTLLWIGVLIHAVSIASIGSAVATPLSPTGKADMAKCNATSRTCNHRCDWVHAQGTSGLGACQDKCDSQFANCVGKIETGRTTGQPPKGKHPIAPVSVGGSKQTGPAAGGTVQMQHPGGHSGKK